MAAKWSVNRICHLIFTKDHVIHFPNQHQEFYYASTLLVIEIVIRELVIEV